VLRSVASGSGVFGSWGTSQKLRCFFAFYRETLFAFFMRRFSSTCFVALYIPFLYLEHFF
ncbi:hypothetical protein AAHB56_00340, partial [Bacillus thuringiensis]